MHNIFLYHYPQTISNITSGSGDYWIQVALMIATFLAVIVALFQEKIKDWFNQARLKLEIKLEPPDCHQIDLTDQSTGQFVSKSIYIRIRVTNTSYKTAKNVEIIAANLFEGSNGSLKVVKSFLPMNLVWSHLHPTVVTIPPKSFRFCDLGPFRPIDGKTIFKFDTVVQPNPVSGGLIPNVINSGEYVLELLISGENVKPEQSRWRMKFSSNWSDNESTMLKRIAIEKL